MSPCSQGDTPLTGVKNKTARMIPTLQRDHISREWEILHNVIDTDQDIKVVIPEIYGGFYVVQLAETVKVYRM